MAQNSNGGGTHISGGNVTIGAMSTGDNSTATSYQYAQSEPRAEQQRAEPIRVLFVFSNPYGTDDLHLGMEWRAIQEALSLSSQRERIESHCLFATTADDLRRKLLERPFHIVHMAGHGGPHGFVLANAQGHPHTVSQQALALCFENYRQTLRCVLLNACYSTVIGQGIALGIPVVIALSSPLGNQASVVFARGFYDALGAGTEIERAYREGLSAIRFANLDRDCMALLLRE